MRQRTTAEFSDLTDALIHAIERHGYAVSVHHRGDYVEMHAAQLKEPCPQHIGTVWDGDEEAMGSCSRRERGVAKYSRPTAPSPPPLTV